MLLLLIFVWGDKKIRVENIVRVIKPINYALFLIDKIIGKELYAKMFLLRKNYRENPNASKDLNRITVNKRDSRYGRVIKII